jgi:UTP--glucose-1-phosphate uridylyltransferase
VILADDLINGEPNALKQMVDLHSQYRCSIIGIQNVARAETKSYGIVQGNPIAPRLHKMDAIVEKPSPEKAPSTMAVVGRYILTPRIFSILERIPKGAGGEIQLTDAIGELLKHEAIYAYEFSGKRYDCGSKLGYLQATVEYALEHPELKRQFRDYLKTLKL